MNSLTRIFAALAFSIAASSPAADKTLMDYFLPTPIIGALTTNVWGAPGVFPRDPQNGLEDQTMKQWCYWDGQLIKGTDGKYHLFASRWDQAKGHNGWFGSVAVHAVSDNPVGPYVDRGICWPDSLGGKGHNVTALVLPNDEGYAVIVSETRPGAVFISKSLDGPWIMKGLLTVTGQTNWRASNVSVMIRPDGDYMIVPRNGQVMISKAADGICGPYQIVGPAYPKGIPNLEDPVVWYSGGLYHIVVNSWSTRTAYHLTSKDGKTNWVNRGLAYDPRKDFVRYTDGTVNHWDKMERPGVLLENGHVKYFTLAALDVEKNQERGNDTHGSKVVVIPFDGEAFDRDMVKTIAAEDAAARTTLAQTPATNSPPPGKLAARPLFRDPPFDAPTDPVLCFNAESKKWFMYYTQRRATATNTSGVEWVHGCNIGMAESSDGGATWTYRGNADISYGKDIHPNDYTYWAPEVIWVAGTYHMYLSYVPGIFNDWNHPREIVHLTSKDGIKWNSLGKVDLKSERVIDACVMQLPSGLWRMWYKDERRSPSLSYADSPDLNHWEVKGNAVTNFSGEGPKAFHWQGKFWLIADCWRNGMRVWSSDDCRNWKLQPEPLFGSHGDVVVSGDRAWWFYFGPGRRTAVEVVELKVSEGKLLPGDPKEPTYMDLKPVREEER